MRIRFAAILAVVLVFLTGAEITTRFRFPSASGTLYPADRAALQTAVQRLLSETNAAAPPGLLTACIVPHDGYGLSGHVAAQAFKLLQMGQYTRIIILSPTHYASFRGCSVPAVQAYRMPMGDIVLDGPAIQQLTFCTLISRRSVRYKPSIVELPESASKNKRGTRKAKHRAADMNKAATLFQPRSARIEVHEPEYGDEVLLPFLQEQVGVFGYVPVIVGEFVDYGGNCDDDAITAAARQISSIIDDKTLLIVSTNFTQHGPAYHYEPFKENILENVEEQDKRAIGLIIARDYDGFKQFLKETDDPICGKNALLLLIKILPKDTIAQLLDYDISARKTNNLGDAVGYASVIFVDPMKPAAEPNPEAAIPPPATISPTAQEPQAPAPPLTPAPPAAKTPTS